MNASQRQAMAQKMAQAQAMANEVFEALSIAHRPLMPQNKHPDISDYHMFSRTFRYSGVFCHIVVTIYAEKPPEISFCATGRSTPDWCDEVNTADNAQDLLAMIPITIGRAKNVERQENHEIQQPKWNGRTQADGGAVSGLAHRRRNH